MGKLNYSNRKSEGVKLGQIVAKDLKKKYISHQAASVSTSKNESGSERSPSSSLNVPLLELNLGGKHLTDEGILEMLSGLREVLGVDGTAHVKLHSLALCGNNLTMRSLAELSSCIEAAAPTLEELDISANSLVITNQQDAADWEHFLNCIAECSVMRKLNMCGNKLGSLRSMEIFCRVHTRHFKLNSKRLSHIYDEQGYSSDPEAATATATLQQMENLNLRELDPHSKSRIPKGSIFEKRDPRRRALGIVSTHCILMQENELNDCGALFLSYVLTQRAQLLDRFPSAMPPQSSIHGPIENVGIVYLPNDKLSTYGAKLLKISETFTEEISEGDENTSFNDGQQSSSPLQPRKTSNASTHSRKTSIGSGIESYQIMRTAIPQSSREEIGSLRRKMQRTVLEETGGASTVDLWKAALVLLSYGRQCIIEPCSSMGPRKSSTTGRPRFSEHGNGFGHHLTPEYAANIIINPRESVDSELSITRTSEGPVTPQILKYSFRSRKDSSNHSSNGSLSSPSQQTPTTSPSDYGELPQGTIKMEKSGMKLIGPLPENAWVLILGEVADPLKVLSTRQKAAVIEWGSNRQTLAAETDLLGKPTSIQIWKVLDGMGCFAYDEVE